MTDVPDPRKGTPSPRFGKAEFRRRFLNPFQDPVFEPLSAELDKIAGAAWDAYAHQRKSPRTRKAGPGFHDPDHDLAVDWIAARGAIEEAQRQYDDEDGPDRFLLISGSSRSEHTCPGEMAKSYRLIETARDAIEARAGMSVEVLDLSRVASEYGRNIHPCKACFSTAAPLCHWPCSCYPNYSLGQAQDWMNEIYPMWVRAHGVMDRLVCADGGNSDPTRTRGKDARLAKQVELDGWDYPGHLAGRIFSVMSYGDVEGAENVRRSLADWLRFMRLVPAGPLAELDRYIGYWKPYATNHQELDADQAVQEEVRNAARTLGEAVSAKRRGRQVAAGETLKKPRLK